MREKGKKVEDLFLPPFFFFQKEKKINDQPKMSTIMHSKKKTPLLPMDLYTLTNLVFREGASDFERLLKCIREHSRKGVLKKNVGIPFIKEEKGEKIFITFFFFFFCQRRGGMT